MSSQTANFTSILPTKTEIEYVHQKAMEDQGVSPLYINESHMDSALGSIVNAILYSENPSIVEIAMLHARRIAEAHAFQDGNKRAGFGAMLIFLGRCGVALDMTDHECADFMVDLITRNRSDDELAYELNLNLYKLEESTETR